MKIINNKAKAFQCSGLFCVVQSSLILDSFLQKIVQNILLELWNSYCNMGSRKKLYSENLSQIKIWDLKNISTHVNQLIVVPKPSYLGVQPRTTDLEVCHDNHSANAELLLCLAKLIFV